MAYLKRPGARLYFEDTGKGYPLLLTHGFAATAAMWDKQMDALHAGYRVIRWDMRGHGRTETDNDDSAYSEQIMIDDMTALLDQCEIDHAAIAGLSLGGYMSLAFYRSHPDRTALLGLFDTGPGFKDTAARESWNNAARDRARNFETDGLEPALRYANETYLNRLEEPLSDMSEIGFQYHRGVAGLAAAARGLLTQQDSSVIESLPDIAVSALIIVGSEDKPFLPASNYMAKKIPDAEFMEIAGAGHGPNITHPEIFNGCLRSFLDRHS